MYFSVNSAPQDRGGLESGTHPVGANSFAKGPMHPQRLCRQE